MEKGVLSSIRNMFGRKPAQGNTGPTVTAPKPKPAAAPAAPAAPTLSGRAEDHAEHVTNMARMMQERGNAAHAAGPVKSAMHELSQGHQIMQRARTAYDAGDHGKARQFLLGAQAHMDHAEAAHGSTAAIHGDSLSSRIKEMHGALTGNTMAKAEQADPYRDMVASLHRSH